MPSPPPALSRALALYRARKLGAARQAYADILRFHPEHPEALHGLALVELAENRREAGIALLERCLVRRPHFAEALTNLGNALLAAQRPDQALAAHDRALAVNAQLAEVHVNRGNALQALRRPEEAMAAFRRALELKPELPEANNNVGNMLRALGRGDEAIAAYRAALQARPDYVDAWYNLGNALYGKQRWDEAEAAYRRALALAPAHVAAHSNLGTALKAQGRREEAVAEFRAALALRPDHAEAHANLGDVFQDQDRLDEAIASYERALAANPRHVEAWCNLGNALTALNRSAEASRAYARALAIQPELAEVKYNDALGRLRQGELPGGWENYECRWEAKPSRGRRPFLPPLWVGDGDLAGRTILVYAEQGLGDTLQFVRYVPLLAARGADVLLEVQPPLKALLAGLPGARRVCARGEALPPFDLHCPLLSLPRAFRTSLASIPAEVPYLRAPAEKSESWRLFFSGRSGPRVGLVWAGSTGHRNDRNRSIPFASFRRIFADKAGSFFSLQKEVRPADAPALAETVAVTDLGPKLEDFTDTAAIISQLDLVVAVDTSVVHLAGALGVPTWLLLPFAPDWRWLLGRSDSPWYPTLRLFRQPAPGDWASVLETVRQEWERVPPNRHISAP